MDISEDIIDNSFESCFNEESNAHLSTSDLNQKPNIKSSSVISSENTSDTDEEESMLFKVKHKKKLAIIDTSDDDDDTNVDDAALTSRRDISISNNFQIITPPHKAMEKFPETLSSSSTDIVNISANDVQVEKSDNIPTIKANNANQSILFTVPRTRKIPIIESDSDTDSDNTSNDSSKDKAPEALEGMQKQAKTRLSENFRNIKSDFCSTMVGNDLFKTNDSESEDIIDVSDDDDAGTMTQKPHVLVQRPILAFIKPPTVQGKTPSGKTVENTNAHQGVSRTVYEEQGRTVKRLEMELAQVANIFRTVDLSKLPDKGALLRGRYESIEKSLQIAKDKYENMVPSTDEALPGLQRKPLSWDDIKVESDIVQPKTLGQRALQTYNVQKSLTMERLQQLHGSISNCPKEDTMAEDPKGLKVELMNHQKHALAWLLWREKQQPSGGILADDMGLGKTLTMISLMLKSLEEAPDRNKENEWKGREKELIEGGTLIICPASLVKQWEAEVGKHCRRGLINIDCYHGPKREPKAKYLAKYDMVITTYTICQTEMEKSTPLFRINWRRIILDEGHQIRNYKSRTSMAVGQLETKSRWILTGTPVHNKELDMYALMKFLRCTPFDDYVVWKRWIANKDTGGYQRLQTVISSLMLRRTKAELREVGALKSLPERTWKIVDVTLPEDEMAIYEKVLIFSKTIFAQYLHQRSNKGTLEDLNKRPTVTKPVDPNSPYYRIYQKMANRCKEVKQHEILLILLRLRQCCCHPSLITQMLERAEFEEDDDVGVDNLMEELQRLDLEDNDDGNKKNVEITNTKKFNVENPLFSHDYKSRKVGTILETVKDITEVKREKVIIVSQWTSFLKLIGSHLAKEHIRFEQLDGTLKIEKRMEIVQNMNNSSHPSRVLLLSLTAGGVGLNLIGANHLLLVDIHWNPQLELQAQDRIYRVGQERPVNIYKFITKNTIEEQVKNIQDYKLSIADSMLTGAKIEHTKLSLQDLRMLFNM